MDSDEVTKSKYLEQGIINIWGWIDLNYTLSIFLGHPLLQLWSFSLPNPFVKGIFTPVLARLFQAAWKRYTMLVKEMSSLQGCMRM